MDGTTVNGYSPDFTIFRNVTKRKVEYVSTAWITLFDCVYIIHCENQHLDLQVRDG